MVPGEHDLNLIYFQIDHDKIIERKQSDDLYGTIYDQSMIKLVGKPGNERISLQLSLS